MCQREILLAKHILKILLNIFIKHRLIIIFFYITISFFLSKKNHNIKT